MSECVRAIPDEKNLQFVIFLSSIVIVFVTIHDKQITNHDIISFSFSLQKKITIRDILSCLDVCLIKALRQ